MIFRFHVRWQGCIPPKEIVNIFVSPHLLVCSAPAEKYFKKDHNLSARIGIHVVRGVPGGILTYATVDG